MKTTIFIFSRFFYQASTLIFYTISLETLPGLTNFIAHRPVIAFMISIASLNVDGGFFKRYINIENYKYFYDITFTIKFFSFLILLPLIIFNYYFLNGSVQNFEYFLIGILMYSFLQIILPIQNIMIKRNNYKYFAYAFFLPLSILYLFFTVLSLIYEITNPIYTKFILITITLFLATLSFLFIKLLSIKLRRFNFREFRLLLGNCFDTYLFSNSANLIELIPFLLISSLISIESKASLSIAFSIYYTGLIYPFLFLIKRNYINNKFPKIFLIKKSIFTFWRIILYSFILVIILQIFIFLIKNINSDFINNYEILINYFSLLIFCLPLTVLRSILSLNLFSSNTSCVPTAIFSSILFFGIYKAKISIMVNNPFLCLFVFESAFLLSIIFINNKYLKNFKLAFKR